MDSLTEETSIIVAPVLYVINTVVYSIVTSYMKNPKRRRKDYLEYNIPKTNLFFISLFQTVFYVGTLVLTPLLFPEHFLFTMQLSTFLIDLLFLTTKKITGYKTLAFKFLIYIAIIFCVAFSYNWPSFCSLYGQRIAIYFYILFLLSGAMASFISMQTLLKYPAMQCEYTRNYSVIQLLLCILIMFLLYSMKNPEHVTLYDAPTFCKAIIQGFKLIGSGFTWLYFLLYILSTLGFDFVYRQLTATKFKYVVPICCSSGFIVSYILLVLWELANITKYSLTSIFNPYNIVAFILTTTVIFLEEYYPESITVVEPDE
ncbi:hypothetical protein WA158_001129 [Blastocystis sp. Blastoise]